MLRFTAVAVVGLLVGCAAPPNTPGAGAGASYTPLVDMQGVDQSRYYNDLAQCRQYAASIDVNREAGNAAVGGAIFGAAIMAALGGNSRQVGQVGSASALGAMNRQTGRAMTRQEMVMGNCLASRGYRVLDGTAQVSFVQAMPGQQPSAPVAPTTAVAAPSVDAAAQPLQPAPAAPSAAPQATGTDSYVAERVAKQAGCNSTALAKLVAKGPGFESYSMQCANSDVMMIRCEMGTCRVLK
jgi:hypothetical protein